MSRINKIDMRASFWNGLRRFDTIYTLCKGMSEKLQKMKEEHPGAILDISTIENITTVIACECENALETFETIKAAKINEVIL